MSSDFLLKLNGRSNGGLSAAESHAEEKDPGKSTIRHLLEPPNNQDRIGAAEAKGVTQYRVDANFAG